MEQVAKLKNPYFKRGDPAKLRQFDPAKQRRGEHGQSLVELALSLTIILLLLAGAVDFSMAYFSFSAM